MNAEEKALAIGKILDAKKADDITVLKVQNITSITDYYVIATARNTVHAKALCDEVEKAMSAQKVLPRNIEGYQSAMWILMDYDNVIVHLFYEETRHFYDLERLWADAPRIQLTVNQ